LRDLLEPHAPALVAKVVELALAGDTTALRIAVDRIIPPAKARDELIRLPLAQGSLAEKGEAVIAALGEGVIAPDVAGTILQGIAAQARIIEFDELEKRIGALEQLAQRGA
jgi:hypothetical protein